MQVHGWLLLGGDKMSNSSVNRIAPADLTDDYGVDPVRYHLLRDIPLGSDGEFSAEGISARYNADLANNLGNLLARVATVVGSKCGGVGPAPDPDSRLAGGGRRRGGRGHRGLGRRRPHLGLEATWRLIRETNAELEIAEPWKAEPGPAVDAVLGSALEVLRIVAVLVVPAMPSTAREIWRRIGLDGAPEDQRLPDAAGLGRLPRRTAGGEGRTALPAAQGLSRVRATPCVEWFDSHCHLQDEFDQPGPTGPSSPTPTGWPAAIARASEAGVTRMVCVGTGAASSAEAVALARAPAAAGRPGGGRGRGALGDRRPASP